MSSAVKKVLSRIGSRSELHRRRSSLEPIVADFDLLEAPLAAKTDLIDELSTVWPLNVQVPGIIVVGARGAGKSTLLQTLTGVPLPNNGPLGPTRRPIRIQICPDPTTKKAYALVGTSDPTFLDKSNVRCIEKLDQLPKFLSRMCYGASAGADTEEGVIEEEDRTSPIYVKVVRPSGTGYTVVDLPGVDENDPESIRVAEEFLTKDPSAIILAVLPVGHVFDNPLPILLAKKVDPESKRTIGVVTKTDLVEKDMDLVEKLQMTSRRDLSLPLGYVAVISKGEDNKHASRLTVLEKERDFFLANPLLQGLRTDRWGTVTLKQLIVRFQCTAIAQSIPELSRRLHIEIDELEAHVKESGKRIEDHQEFFTKLCSDTTAMAFEIEDLATSASTRADRNLNLGARLAQAIKSHEEEARRALPEAVASKIGAWLDIEVTAPQNEARTYVSRETLYHDLFRKSVRAVCGPVLRVYTTALLDDISAMLKDVTHGLVVERFRGFPWLVESLKHEVDLLLERKKAEARRVLDRIINSEVNWIFVNEADLNAIEREVALNMTGKTGGGLGVHKAVPTFAEPHDPSTHWSAELSKVVGPEELQSTALATPLSRLDPDRDMRIRQLALDAYVRLMLRRVFYAVPMNVRNVLLSEFRRDLVSMVAEKYNTEFKLRAVMSEEIWLGQLRQHRQDRKSALEGVLARIDQLA